jgi:hypothetical protein
MTFKSGAFAKQIASSSFSYTEDIFASQEAPDPDQSGVGPEDAVCRETGTREIG